MYGITAITVTAIMVTAITDVAGMTAAAGKTGTTAGAMAGETIVANIAATAATTATTAATSQVWGQGFLGPSIIQTARAVIRDARQTQLRW